MTKLSLETNLPLNYMEHMSLVLVELYLLTFLKYYFHVKDLNLQQLATYLTVGLHY